MLRWPQVVRWIQWEGESKLSAESGSFSKAEAFEEQLLKDQKPRHLGSLSGEGRP